MAKFDRIFNSAESRADVKKEVHPRRETKWIHYTKLQDNDKQYCNEKDKAEIIALAGIIDADGMVLQNLLVRKINTDEYEIIAGHKRRRACRYLVEEEGKKEYEFLPCTIESISDIRAEFQLYSSNSHHEKDDYERMHELERMKYLLENYPEEFPHLQTGRMVERLAKQMNMKKTTVGEYLTISKNLGEKAMEAFRAGEMNKSAALEISSLPEAEQNTLVEQGVTVKKDIQAYKVTKEPQEAVQIKGQLKIADTEMNIIEDVPESGTRKREKNVPESGTQKPEKNVPKSGTQETENDVPKSGTGPESEDRTDLGFKKCLTGYSKYGVCSCCGSNGINCCIECDQDCNVRCGWIDEAKKQYEQADVKRLLNHFREELKAYREADMPEDLCLDREIMVDALNLYLQELKRQEADI